MSDSNYTKIFTGNFMIGQRIVEALEKVNIHAVVRDETESGLLKPVFGGSNSDYQDIFVHNDELNKSIPIVEAINREANS
ncbi:DUF2007 domain-containing protein [Mariniflexile ostreae]|uniref:DUF2007 domain-containing protein n=1 Tax=Mariniflexile ostreae TaxID=1520892 RepID=A0ABV5FFR7_9FLAO